MTHLLDPIETSLELAAERAGDLTPLVYARLFAAHPDMEAMFVRDQDGAVRGQMLFQVFDAILDFAGPRRFAANLVRTELVNHDAFGVPPAVFAIFFATVRDTVRDATGDAWTPAMDLAWRSLLADLDTLVAVQAAEIA